MISLEAICTRLEALPGDDFALIATRPDGEIVFWNRGARRLYGWTEAEAKGRNVVDLTPAVQSRPESTEIMDTLRHGESWAGEFLLRKKGGALFRAFVTDLPLAIEADPAAVILGVSGPLEHRSAITTYAENLQRALAE